jgi:hypothetical protein
MPSFSLPGTSIGTAEAEEYLMERHRGASRSKAAKGFLRRGLKDSYPKHLEKMFRVAVSRAKALFPTAADVELGELEWIWAVCGKAEQPLTDLNRFCLDGGMAPVCFCRSSILVFDRRRIAGVSSHNLLSTEGSAAFIDSG